MDVLGWQTVEMVPGAMVRIGGIFDGGRSRGLVVLRIPARSPPVLVAVRQAAAPGKPMHDTIPPVVGRTTRKGGVMDVKRIGIIGAGTMGRGIAQVCAESGF